MNPFNLIVSSLPVILIAFYIYLKDKNRESPYLIIFLFLGGILSAVVALLTTDFINSLYPSFSSMKYDLGLFSLIFYNFILVGFKEELLKFTSLYIISYHHSEFDEIYDALIYGAFVGIGFAAFENIIYLKEFNLSFFDTVIRGVMASGLHLISGITMGFFMGHSRYFRNKGMIKKSILYSVLTVIIPTLIHGMYNIIIMLTVKYNIVILDIVLQVFFLFSMYLAYVFYNNFINSEKNYNFIEEF